MRQITLSMRISNEPDSVIQSDKLYNFILPNEARPAFKNRKLAEKFVKDSEKMFTHILYELNEIYFRLYADFRTYIFNMDLVQENKFENIFQLINGNLYRAWEKSVLGSNGVYYSHKSIMSAIDSTKAVLKKLDILYKEIKIHQRIINNRTILGNIERMELKLKNWGWNHHKPWGKFKEMNISKFENDYFKDYPLY